MVHYAFGLPEVPLHRLRAACFGLLAATTLAGLLGTALSPYLLVKNPLLLVALSPAAHHVALAAATVEPGPLITLATLRRVLTGVGAFGIGFIYREQAIAWLEQRYPKLAKLVAYLERLFARLGVLLLVVAPVPTLAVLAGAARGSFFRFLGALTLGHALWNTGTYYLGDAFASWTAVLTEGLGDHLLESTLVCVLLVVVQQSISLLRRRRSAP